MSQPPEPHLVTLTSAEAVAAVLRRGLEPFVCPRCGVRFPAAQACPVCDADPRRVLLTDAVRLALAQENDARAAFLRSEENGPYDPFASDDPGPRFLAYRSAAEVCGVARRALELYDAVNGVEKPFDRVSGLEHEFFMGRNDDENPPGVWGVPLTRDE